MSFFNEYIVPCLDTTSKSYSEVVDDYMFIYEIITSNYNMRNVFVDYKKDKYLSNHCKRKCKKIFYNHIRNGSDYSLLCSNLLSDKPSSKDTHFAFSMFKKTYKDDVLLSVNLLKIIDNYGENVDNFLSRIVHDNEMNGEFRNFVIKLLDFHNNKINNISWPIVYHDPEQRKIVW